MAGRKSAKKDATNIHGGKRKLNDHHLNESPSKGIKLSKDCKIKDDFAGTLQEKYGMNFPDDLFLFYEFFINNKCSFECTGLKLIGPFDVLFGNFGEENKLSKLDYQIHGRFYYDVPEMMTLMYANNDDGFHIAYFRDFPDQLPELLVSNRAEINGELTICGDNVFAAVALYCKVLSKSVKEANKLKELKTFCELLEKTAKSYNYQLEAMTSRHKARNKNVVTKSFHKAGLVVMLDKNELGYRELPVSDRDLKKLLKKIVKTKSDNEKNKAFDELQEMITLVQFANDECDYGMGYELGIDLFTFGHETFTGTISHLLPLAYQLLQRDMYGEIIEKHLENRKKNGPLSLNI